MKYAVLKAMKYAVLKAMKYAVLKAMKYVLKSPINICSMSVGSEYGF